MRSRTTRVRLRGRSEAGMSRDPRVQAASIRPWTRNGTRRPFPSPRGGGAARFESSAALAASISGTSKSQSLAPASTRGARMTVSTRPTPTEPGTACARSSTSTGSWRPWPRWRPCSCGWPWPGRCGPAARPLCASAWTGASPSPWNASKRWRATRTSRTCTTRARISAPSARRMAALEAELRDAGEQAVGPGHYALGRGYLALGDEARARESLESAW